MRKFCLKAHLQRRFEKSPPQGKGWRKFLKAFLRLKSDAQRCFDDSKARQCAIQSRRGKDASLRIGNHSDMIMSRSQKTAERLRQLKKCRKRRKRNGGNGENHMTSRMKLTLATTDEKTLKRLSELLVVSGVVLRNRNGFIA